MLRQMLIVFCMMAIWACPIAYGKNTDSAFHAFILEIKQQARQRGVSNKTLDKYLDPLKAPKVAHRSIQVRRLHHQAQAVLGFEAYLDRLINDERVNKGRRLYHEHADLLKRVEQTYGVPPQIIVALWGLESNYGQFTGHFHIINSLSRLAYQHHRSRFYKNQLIDALIILDYETVIPQEKKSAWDGGMGQPQFEPSSYLAYAVDYDDDDFRNIWTNLPDIFASIANYLKQNGWHRAQPWGFKVILPKHFSPSLINLKRKQLVSQWVAIGVKRVDAKPLPLHDESAAIIRPNGKSGPVFIVYHNFDVLQRWNHTFFESLAAGTLADEILE